MAEIKDAEQIVDGRILRFIGRHRVMTLACCSAGEQGLSDGGELWCCNLFYAYMPTFGHNENGGSDGGAFVFTSPEQTRHAAIFGHNPQVAGSIVLESRVVARLQGLQFQGVVHRADESNPELLGVAKKAYLKRFPFAVAMLSDLWVMEITSMKYTDNTLGFGTKLHWTNVI